MITTADELINALANNSQKAVIYKVPTFVAVAGQVHSLFTSPGQPTKGVAPTAVEICTRTTVGALPYANAGGSLQNYVTRFAAISTAVATDLQLHDRLMHCGGFVANVTTVQIITNMNAALLPAARRGADTYSELQWWIEVYADLGGSAQNINVAVTYDDGSTATIPVGVTATSRNSRLFPILPVASSRNIRQVNSVQLAGSTGAAGNFGVTCTRHRCGVSLGIANSGTIGDFQSVGMPQIADDVCLMLMVFAGATTLGNIAATIQISKG